MPCPSNFTKYTILLKKEEELDVLILSFMTIQAFSAKSICCASELFGDSLMTDVVTNNPWTCSNNKTPAISLLSKDFLQLAILCFVVIAFPNICDICFFVLLKEECCKMFDFSYSYFCLSLNYKTFVI